MPKILLVEDNELNRDMLSRRLQRRGFEIITAADGEKGIALTASERPDLVLMDISLPGVNGWDATKQIRRNGMTTPIIALTAHAMSGDREKTLEAGCDEYETKPVELEILLSKIQALLNRRDRA
jgi:two-component system, cell cycle response regulator DivK